MAERRGFLTFFILLHFYQGSAFGSVYVQPTPSSVVVNPGDKMNFMCRIIKDGSVYSGRLDTCTFRVAETRYSMKPGKSKDGVSYYGAGLEAGECGITLVNIGEKHNGNINCSLSMDTTDPTEFQGLIQVVVAIPPQNPEMEVNVGTEGTPNSFRERDMLTATCTVRDGRPAANISWYLGDELITQDARPPVEICTPQKKNLCSIQQNLTRSLQASDDKKSLRCVANHYALMGKELSSPQTLLNVNYPPKPSSKPFERFGLQLGEDERVPIVIEANPRPVISWNVAGDNINEGTDFGRYRVEKTQPQGPGQFETTLIISSLTKEDTERIYKVTAHNELGEEVYSVSISTGPEPKVLEMGAGLIIVIVVTIVVILLVLGAALYARAKGKLCFAGADARRGAGESSDTESAEHTTDHKPKMTFVSVFKKKSDKVAADKEMLQNMTVDDKKSESREQPPELKDAGESVVYAELDLGGSAHQPGTGLRVRGDDDKTEYAEIIHSQPPPPPK